MSQFLGTRQPHIFGCSIFTRFIYGIYGIIKPITSSIDKHVWSISTSRVWSKTDFEVIRHPLNRDRSGAANWIYILNMATLYAVTVIFVHRRSGTIWRNVSYLLDYAEVTWSWWRQLTSSPVPWCAVWGNHSIISKDKVNRTIWSVHRSSALAAAVLGRIMWT